MIRNESEERIGVVISYKNQRMELAANEFIKVPFATENLFDIDNNFPNNSEAVMVTASRGLLSNKKIFFLYAKRNDKVNNLPLYELEDEQHLPLLEIPDCREVTSEGCLNLD